MAATTYIFVSGDADPIVEFSKQRLKDAFAHPASIQEGPIRVSDPFFLHDVIAQDSSLQSKSAITKVQRRLYDQLEVVEDEKSAKKGKTELAFKQRCSQRYD